MEKRYDNATSLLKESHTLPVVKLLLACREEAEMALAVKGDVEAGMVSLRMTPQAAFRLVDKLWKVFMYQGLSFDSIIIDPTFKTRTQIGELHNILLHISVKPDTHDNELKFYINRKK